MISCFKDLIFDLCYDMVLAEDDEAAESSSGDKRLRSGKGADDAGMRLRLAVVVSQCLELLL